MPANIQGNWRWCFKCQGFWYGGFSAGVCPGGGGHAQTGSGNYALVFDLLGAERQSDWRWCSKCQGLWFGGHTGSICPAGGGHTKSGSGNYSLSLNAPNVAEQSDWRWCNKCQGMFWAGPVAQSVIPPACKSIANEIKGLEAERADLQAQLQEASTPQKPALASAIKNLTKQISAKKSALTKCVNQHRPCPAGGSHSGVFSGEYRIPQTPQNVRLHFKVLTAPTTFSTATMLEQMRQVYNTVGIGVDLASTETLNLPALTDLDVGGCNGTPTSEQTQLFQNRNNVAGNDVVIYFVRSTVPPTNGCASHPSGRPGAVVVQTASRWTLAHEVGHVLGLNHADSASAPLLDRLMTGQGTFNITNPPPNMAGSEVSTMKASALTVNA